MPVSTAVIGTYSRPLISTAANRHKQINDKLKAEQALCKQFMLRKLNPSSRDLQIIHVRVHHNPNRENIRQPCLHEVSYKCERTMNFDHAQYKSINRSYPILV